jgi:hypothetical protein
MMNLLRVTPFSSGIHIAMLESKGRDVVALCAAANYAAAKALAKKGGAEKEEEGKEEKEENTHCRQILGFEGGIQTTLHTCVLAPSLASSRGLPNIEVDVTLPSIYIEADTVLINNTMRMIESLVDEHTGSGGSGEGGGGGESKEAGGASSLDINSGGTGVDAGGGTGRALSGAILVSSSSVLLQVFTTRGDGDSTDLTAGGGAGGTGGAVGGAPLPPTTTSIRVGASVSRAELSVEVNLGETIVGSSHGGGATRLVTVFAEELAVEHEGAVGGKSVTRASLNQFAVVDEISGPLDAQQQWERGGGVMGGGARYMLRTIGTTKEGKEGKEQVRGGGGGGGTEEELKQRRTGEAGVPVLAGMTALSPDAFVNLELILRPARPEGGRVEGGGVDERAVNVSRLDISVVTGHVEVLVDMRTVDLLWRFVLVDVVFVDEAKWFRSGVKAGVKVQQQRRRNQLHLNDAKEGETLPPGTGGGTSPAVVSPSRDTSGASSSASASASKKPPPPPPAVTVRAALASLSGSLQGSCGDVAHLHVSAVDVRLTTRPRPLAGSPVGGRVEGHANVHYHRALEMSLAGDAATICGGSRDGFPLLVGLSAKQTNLVKRKTKKGATRVGGRGSTRAGASAGDKQSAPQAVANPVRGMFSGALSESDDSSVLASDDEGEEATRAPLQAQDSITLDMSEEDYDDDDDDDDDDGGGVGGVEVGTVVLEMEEDSEEGEGTDEGDERRDEGSRDKSSSTSSESVGSLGKRGLVVALNITEGHSLSSSSSSSSSPNRPPSQHVGVDMRMGSVRAQVAAPVVLRIVETVLEVVRYRLLEYRRSLNPSSVPLVILVCAVVFVINTKHTFLSVRGYLRLLSPPLPFSPLLSPPLPLPGAAVPHSHAGGRLCRTHHRTRNEARCRVYTDGRRGVYRGWRREWWGGDEDEG